jgi:hypothetical protein
LRSCRPSGFCCQGSSGSVQALTSTVRAPRSSITRTVVPLGRGSGDQAMNASDPPRIFTRTSPGPASPRVATVMTPMQPIADTFETTPCRSSYHARPSNPQGRPEHRPSGPRNTPAYSRVTSPVGVLCPPGLHHCLRGLPFGWSRVEPFAERRPSHRPRHALASTRSRGRCHVQPDLLLPRRSWPRHLQQRWAIAVDTATAVAHCCCSGIRCAAMCSMRGSMTFPSASRPARAESSPATSWAASPG